MTNTWLPVGSLYCADTTDKWTTAAFYLLSGTTTKNVEDPFSLQVWILGRTHSLKFSLKGKMATCTIVYWLRGCRQEFRWMIRDFEVV